MSIMDVPHFVFTSYNLLLVCAAFNNLLRNQQQTSFCHTKQTYGSQLQITAPNFYFYKYKFYLYKPKLYLYKYKLGA